MTPEIQHRIFEVHPELSFWALADNAPLANRKAKQVGFDERKALLEQATGLSIPTRADAFKLRRSAKPDDLLDAMVAAWTARRVAEGDAKRLPADPELDATGLRTEIVYSGR